MNIDVGDEINIGEEVSKEFKKEVEKIVSTYEPREPKEVNLEMKIIMKEEEPIASSPRRLPFAERKIVEDQVEEWMKNGIIEPTTSDFASPVAIARKKDGSPRICVDYRRVNKVIAKDRYPLPPIEDPTKWYKFVGKVQQLINSSRSRSIGTSPFELLTGVQMRTKVEENIKTIIEEEMRANCDDSREELRNHAKTQIKKVQEENRKSSNLRRRPARRYRENDLVAIRRTQAGPGLKLKSKYLGPYKVSKVKPNDTYDVQKDGYHEGPMKTTTCAEYMKPWQDPSASSETEDEQDGRAVGSEGTP